jgi:hypothetical protein
VVTISTKPPVLGGVDAGEMQPRNQSHRHGLIATLPLALLLAACGAGAAPSSAPRSTPTPVPSATPAPTPVPTPSPTAVPTPLPEPPLAVLSKGRDLKVVNSQGVEQWGLTSAQEGQFFGLTAQQANNPDIEINAKEGGSNLFLFYQVLNSTGTKLAVVSRTGKLLGMVTLPSLAYWAFVVSPTGAEWAWTVDQTPNAPGKHDGVIEVGGLGEAVRTVYHWVAPVGFEEQLVGWTNTGIIMQRWEYGGCGILYDPAAAWFALNPSTGTLTELFTGNDQFMGASSGVTVAALIDDGHAVLINGVKYAESKSTIVGANISPDGAHVAVSRISDYEGCAGYIPKNTVEMVTVANQSHVDLQNLTAVDWWDDDQFIANNLSGSTWIYNLQGSAVSEICSASSGWGFSGVLTG